VFIFFCEGFISCAAALCARHLAPECTANNLFFSHKSEEKGALLLLQHLKGTAPLNAKMRLGEGTGALMCVPFLKCAAKLVTDMASLKEVLESTGNTSVNETDKIIHTEGMEMNENKSSYSKRRVYDKWEAEYRIFLTSIMFLTRLPAYMLIPDLDHNVFELVPSFGYFPLVGLLVGVFTAIVFSVSYLTFNSLNIAILFSTVRKCIQLVTRECIYQLVTNLIQFNVLPRYIYKYIYIYIIYINIYIHIYVCVCIIYIYIYIKFTVYVFVFIS
jgi:hypothetical protein